MLQRPWLVGGLALRLLRRWLVLLTGGLRARRGAAPDAVLVGYLGHFDVVLARLLFPGTPVVLDHLIFAADTARDRGESGGVKQWLLRAVDALAIRCADVVIVDTEEHLWMLPRHRQADAVVCPVGASDDWFRGVHRTSDDTGGPTHAIFYGLFTPLQGAVTIAEACAKIADRTDLRLTMVGSGQHLAAARHAASGVPWITWVDWVPAGELPALVAGADVCLGIFGSTPKAARVVPNKVYQGAAAGCVVVTSDTPPQRRTLGDAALLVPPGDATALALALERLAEDEPLRRQLAARSAALAQESFSPEAIAAPLHEKLMHLGRVDV
jgi:glycosyltransferase involved in cell wall biosynthesis